MKKTFLSLFLVSIASSGLAAGLVKQMIIENSPAHEAAAQPLRNSPPQEYEFDQAVLGDVLRLLAHDAGISFFSLPEDADGADRLVTFKITTSPFAALETLSKANNVSLVFDNGIWYLRPANDKSLIGRTYEIKYNALERVTQSSTGGGTSSGSSLGGGGGAGGGMSSGISLQGNPETFQVEPSELLDDIRELLDLPTTGFSATLASNVSVDSLMLGQQLPTTVVNPNDPIDSGSSSDAGSNAKVIWNSDANTLYVVATRQQHQWIEGYLASVDQPQDLIALEVKFFESDRDPREEFGLDWTGTLSGGYNVALTGTGGISQGPDGTASGDPISGPIDLNRIGDYRLPTAILSYEALNVRLRALLEDQEINAVSYPRMVTLNNREVLLRSVVNQPVLSASSSTSVGAGATQTSSVAYLPIGTVLNILPKKMSDGAIHLSISITISNIIGQELIDGNPYPIATSRVYSAPVVVDSGYSVAIGGLDEAVETRREQGVPIIGKLPLIGYAFKYKDHSRNRKHLMFFVTPSLISGHDGGIPDEPQAVVRRTPHDAPRPHVQPDGSLVGSIEALPGVVEGVTREIDALEQTVLEGRSTAPTHERIEVLYVSCESTIRKLQYNMEQDPQGWEELREYQWQFSRMTERLGRIRRQNNKKKFGFRRDDWRYPPGPAN